MHTSTGNHMLDGFSHSLQSRLLTHAERVTLPQHRILCESGETPRYVYFLTRGLCSVVVTMQSGGSAEVSMCGKEGLVCAHSLLGAQPSPAASFMQITGEGFRIPHRVAEALFAESEEFRTHVMAWIQMSIYVSLQTSACGLLHEAEQRLARWLLMSSDRTESDTLPLTQEFLAEMLGTQRTTVAVVAGELRRKGLIDYVRGNVTILDRKGLSHAACECYNVSQQAILQLNRESVAA
ncbi:MAG: Crp/Fnr family transcriptional regulator [Terriglobus sp.]